MISKVAFAQPVYNQHKHDFKESKDGFNKKKSALFASVLEKIIKSQPNGK